MFHAVSANHKRRLSPSITAALQEGYSIRMYHSMHICLGSLVDRFTMLRTVLYRTVSLICEINYRLSESNPAIIASRLARATQWARYILNCRSRVTTRTSRHDLLVINERKSLATHCQDRSLCYFRYYNWIESCGIERHIAYAVFLTRYAGVPSTSHTVFGTPNHRDGNAGLQSSNLTTLQSAQL